jgi:hypothetical protein
MIAALITWAAANPLYAFVGLVGFVVGIFYGFDGWRADTKEVDFKDSPRLKNLVWVLGGGFAAFFGDLKALDPTANKLLALFAYFLPCVVAGIAVVLFWGVVIAIERLWATYKGQTDGYAFIDAVGDYFFYGYGHYRKRSAEAGQNAGVTTAAQNEAASFQVAYSQQLSLAVAAAGSATAATRVETARQILKMVAAVIKSHHRDEKNAQGIRASLMQKKACDDLLRARLAFAGQSAATVAHCLELITYDEVEAEPGIVLPLPKRIQDALPGAPTAFFNRYAIVDDTSQLAFPSGIPQEIQAEIEQYFQGTAFRSFGSIRISGRGEVLGVINVEANVPHVFGKSEDEKRQMISFLLPFCEALAIVVSNA